MRRVWCKQYKNVITLFLQQDEDEVLDFDPDEEAVENQLIQIDNRLIHLVSDSGCLLLSRFNLRLVLTPAPQKGYFYQNCELHWNANVQIPPKIWTQLSSVFSTKLDRFG